MLQPDEAEQGRVSLALDGEVARISLTRPDRHNAIDLAMARELCMAAERSFESKARMVVLSAEGSHFCVGGDLVAFHSQPSLDHHLKQVTSSLHRAISLLVEGPPVLVMVQGAAAGAGLGLVCLADYAIAHESASFRLAYPAVGLSPDAGTSFFLPRLIGPRRTRELVLSNRILSAAEAEGIGLINEVVSAEHANASLSAWEQRLLVASPGSLMSSLRLLRGHTASDLTEHLRAEEESLIRNARSSDAVEGISAFIERRQPVFPTSGRSDETLRSVNPAMS